MPDNMHYQLELSGEAATLYIAGHLQDCHVSTLATVCRSLPAHVRTLRLDMRAVGTMTADATRAIRTLLQGWRERREGDCRLSTSYLVATCTGLERLL